MAFKIIDTATSKIRNFQRRQVKSTGHNGLGTLRFKAEKEKAVSAAGRWEPYRNYA